MTRARRKTARKVSPEAPWFKHPRMVSGLDLRDQRPRWQDVRPETGLTLRQAMLYYGEDESAELFLDLENDYGGDPPLVVGLDGWPTSPEILSDFRIKSGRLREARARLEYCLIAKLVTGQLFATGYSGNGSLSGPATRIAADRWRTLVANFERSTARGPGVVVSGILVFEPKSAASADEAFSRFSASELRSWYERWIAAQGRGGTIPSRDEDLRAARETFGHLLPREPLRELRRELAPEEWTRLGRRKRP